MNFDKTFIICEVANLPEFGMMQYRFTCEADCEHRCTLTFETPKGPLFVYADKTAAVFSSLCKRLEKADADNARRVGQRSLISDADKEA